MAIEGDRFAERFLIQLNRMRVWFKALGFEALMDEELFSLLVWQVDTDPAKGCSVRFSAEPRPKLEIHSPAGMIGEAVTIGSLERQYRLITSDDAHALVHDLILDYFGVTNPC